MKEDREMGLTMESVAEKRLNYVQRALEKRIRNRSQTWCHWVGYVGLSSHKWLRRGFASLALTSMGVRLKQLTPGYPMSLTSPMNLLSMVVNGPEGYAIIHGGRIS
jgi:hypothetical protein